MQFHSRSGLEFSALEALFLRRILNSESQSSRSLHSKNARSLTHLHASARMYDVRARELYLSVILFLWAWICHSPFLIMHYFAWAYVLFQILQLQMNDYRYHYMFTTFVSICGGLQNTFDQLITLGSAIISKPLTSFYFCYIWVCMFRFTWKPPSLSSRTHTGHWNVWFGGLQVQQREHNSVPFGRCREQTCHRNYGASQKGAKT